MTEWFDIETGPPYRTFWWAVEHRQGSESHPAFYLRALIAGDFQVGPLPRHALTLEGEPPPTGERVRCGTCGEVPKPADLEPIERVTGDRGHLHPYRAHEIAWPKPTREGSCWLCSSPRKPARNRRARIELIQSTDGQLELVDLCDQCETFVARWALQHPGPHLRTVEGN